MKGQLQVTEPILIIIILGILAGIGIIFFVRISDVEQDQAVERIRELQAIEALQVVSSMPELACPKHVTTDTYCIDLGKAEAFSLLMQEDSRRIFYQPLFGSARIELMTYDVQSGETETLDLYDLLSEEASTRGTSTHFTVYDPLTEERKMAMLTVVRES